MKSFKVKGKPAKKRGTPVPPTKIMKSKKTYNKKNKNNVDGLEDAVNIRSLLSKFVTNIFEKNYSEANSTLSEIIAEKMQRRIKQAVKAKRVKAKRVMDTDDCSCND
jgi:hypothetical protein